MIGKIITFIFGFFLGTLFGTAWGILLFNKLVEYIQTEVFFG